jgi:hypothetical protein
MAHRIKLPNGETEIVRMRYKIPGKNRGFLCVCESLNCYVTFRGTAVWVMDEGDYDRAFVNIREKMLEFYERAQVERSRDSFTAFVKSRLEGTNGKERSLD